MLTMAQIHSIRKMFFEEGKNISQIARETGFDRKTIRLYINKNDWNKKPVLEQLPKQNCPKLNPYKEIIDEWLLADKKARRKQRHTAKRVYDRLVEEYDGSFDCSYRTVAAYVAEKKSEIFKQKEGYLPLEHLQGEAQVDFGDADFYENGALFSGKYLNLSFPYSNKGYFQLFRGENQECLFEGLIAIFNHIVGVPNRLWFDNTKTIVTKILKGGGRDLTDSFLRFQEHYGFEAAFCNPDAGHEKGSVEGKVGYHRRNMLVPIPEFSSLQVFNEELLAKCDKDALRGHYRYNETISKRFERDKEVLLKLPEVALDVARYCIVKTNGYGRFCLNKGLHEYSISPKYANASVLIKITSSEVIPLSESHREIVRHKRLYGKYKQQSMQWLPYLQQLSLRPSAFKYSGIYTLFPEQMRAYLDRCNKEDKGKILRIIASLTEKSGFEAAVKTIEKALCYDAVDVDSLLNLYRQIYHNIKELPPINTSKNLPKLEQVKPDFSKYDAVLGGGAGYVK